MILYNNELKQELKRLKNDWFNIFNQLIQATTMRETLLISDELYYIESEITKIQRKLGALK